MKALYTPRFGSARIIGEPSGFYQLAYKTHEVDKSTSSDAVILSVADRTGALADVVAWLPSDPARWWVRTGAMPVLGEAEIDRAAFLDAPLYLFGTPSDWLFNHGKGGYWPSGWIGR
jgi:hypothetical protein